MDAYNTGDRKDVRRFEKLAKIDEKARLSGIMGIMSVINGRHWMHDLLERCGVFHTPFAFDNSATNFNCGQQNIGLQIVNDIMRVAPDEYVLMMREANERTAAAAERSRDKNGGGDDDPTDATDRADNPDDGNGEEAGRDRAASENVRRV